MPYKQGKKWRGVVKIDGKRVGQKLFASKREAKEWEIAQKKRFQTQTPTIYLHETASKYLDFCQARYSKETYSDKRRVLKELVGITGNVPIERITPEILLDLLLSKPTKNLYNRTRKDLHAFFNYLLNHFRVCFVKEFIETFDILYLYRNYSKFICKSAYESQIDS